MSGPSHSTPPDAVLDSLDTDSDGLSSDTVERRLAEHGPNEVAGGDERSAVDIFVAQFDSVLIWVLLAAAGLSIWAGHTVDAVLIAIIVIANGIFGFVQDYRAEQSLESLRELTAPTATVRRDGTTAEIEATNLVPGDIVELTGGDVVPADCRLVETTSLEVDEAALTGESAPVSKAPDAVPEDTPLAERRSMVYKGTNVTRGRAVAVVTGTGMETEVGAIARELAGTEQTETPLQGELDHLGRLLGLGVLGLTALIVPILLFQGTPIVQAGLTAISLAVAAVPEGLPAVVTLTLALGVRRMADENALVRRLPAVEALGGVDVICTDKTGTLTEGEMSVSRIWLNDTTIDRASTGDEAAAVDSGDHAATVDSEDISADDIESTVETEVSLPDDRYDLLLRAGALCNDATTDDGDPTEQALVTAAVEAGIDVEALRSERPRTDEVPFSSERKWMGTVHEEGGYVKGAPGVVVSNCSSILTDEGPVSLTDDGADRIEEQVAAFADDALRVLAIAYDPEARSGQDLEGGLTFVGLVGMIDPAREEVADAVAATTRAGIALKMITGDNVRTAAAIASSLNMGDSVLEGREIEAMDDDELGDHVEDVDVFARTSPEHKVRILRALKANGHVVAMTGDGVNDAPALKNADVGVAMGVRGTDVAKQASDIVLLDDNYATIVAAVRRGRAIFDNVWKFVAYLLSANVAEVALVFLASLAGYLVLPAVQLLWINLLTDGLPAVALGTDPESGNVMDRAPRDPDRGIVGRGMLGLMGGTGTVSTVVMLGLLFYSLDGAQAMTPYAMTMVFTGFVLIEFAKLFSIRWLRETPTLSNRWLLLAVGASLLLQLGVLYTPLAQYFGTVPLALGDWGILCVVLAVTLPIYLAVATGVKRLAPEL